MISNNYARKVATANFLDIRDDVDDGRAGVLIAALEGWSQFLPQT